MIDTDKFVNELIELKYTHVCAVPCSFLKSLINSCINNNRLEYIPSASEAIACSIAAGLKISGNKPIVLVQSSGLTNMASCITSLLIPYSIRFPIISSWRTYRYGDSEIQHMHLAKALPELIKSYGYEGKILDKNNLESAILEIESANLKPQILIVKANTFSPIELDQKHQIDLSVFLPRSIFLKHLNKKFSGIKNVSFIGTTGNTSREMYAFMKNTNNFYMAGNMGGALSLGLGVSKSGNKVIVCGGDAEFVMHMGGLSTAGRYGKEVDLLYILFDNQQNKSTGGQNTYQQHIDYNIIANGAGFSTKNIQITKISDFDSFLEFSGLNFLWVKCGLDPEEARPPLAVVKNNRIDLKL